MDTNERPMSHLKRRSLCKSCRVCFIRDNDTQVYCHSCLSESFSQSKKRIEAWEERRKRCFICQRWFFAINGRSTCGDKCKEDLVLDNKNRYAKNKKEKEAASEGLTYEGKQWLRLKWSPSSFIGDECEARQ